ncbi:rna helicase [Trichoderma cornu-damae]|uniref:Rna helicase n=1 Tax=Trichoderma cornu-damae TaxID=654480 RepID=A0A9P8QI17_9HYPO|nr:rna helicase [Trichoderma cornu-damae]
MPRSSREPRHSERDGREPRHNSSLQEGSSRRPRDKTSPSPDASPQRHLAERKRRASPGRRERKPKRPRSSDGQRGSSGRAGEQASCAAVELPYGARQISKNDLTGFAALFGEYLSLHKQKYIEDMDYREVRGRWKRFVGKWNRGELAEGWYDPEMFQRILERDPSPEGEEQQQHQQQYSPEAGSPGDEHSDSDGSDGSDGGEDEGYGPVLPGAAASGRRTGVRMPNKQDLALRDELAEEAREADRDALRAARKADRKLQKERLEELVPRAEAGTRERKLEKRQETNEKMRQFRERSPGAEVRDSDLMGGGDSLEDYKKAKERESRRKSDREIRREEIQRAKREEIEQKRRVWQQREDRTVNMLRELAKQRFGPV